MTNNIKSICKTKGITFLQMSKDLNISYRSIQRYAAGTREPDYKTIVDIANYLNVTVDDLLNTEKNKIIPLTVEDFNEIQTLQKRIDEIYKKYEK